MKGILLGTSLLAGSLAVGQDAKVSVEPAGVAVIWNTGDKEEFGHMAVLNSQRPVTLALLLAVGEKKVVAVDEKNSKVTTLTDDQGTDLKGKLGSFPRIAKNGKAVVVEVQGKNPVSAKAGSLIAQGEIKLSVASKTAAKRSKLVELKEGSKVEIDEKTSFEITEVGKPDWGDDPLSLTLTIKRDIPDVAEVRFFDEKGKQIASQGAGSMRSGFLGKVTVGRDFTLKRKVAKLFVEVDRWTDLEEVAAPFDLKVGIGGAK